MKKFFSLITIVATIIGSASGAGYKISKEVSTTANGERQVLRLHLNDPANEQVFYLGSGDAVGVALGASGYGTTYPANRASDFSTQGLVNDIVFPWATSGLQLFSNQAPQQADVPIGTYIGIVGTANDLYAQRGCSLQQAPSGKAWPSALVDYGTASEGEALWGFSANSCPDQGRDDGSGVVIGVYESSSELTSLAITAKVKDRSGTNQDRNIVINVGFSGGNEQLCLNGVYEGDTFNSQSQPLSEADSGFTACQAAQGGGGGGGNPFCDSHTCGSGTTKSGASSIECTSGTCDDATCCDAAVSATCDSHTCGSGTTKSGASSIECASGTCDDATCCDAAASPSPGPSATCDSHACPYGYTLKENPDQISGSDDSTCCDAVSSSSGGGGGVVCQGLDFSEDGVVGAADFLPLLNNYGASCSSL